MKRLQHLFFLWLLCGPAIGLPVVFQDDLSDTNGLAAWYLQTPTNDDILPFHSIDGSALRIGNTATPGDPASYGALFANNIITEIGRVYEISFWLSHEQFFAGENYLSATFGGAFDELNFTNTGGTTFEITDDARNDPDDFVRYAFNRRYR